MVIKIFSTSDALATLEVQGQPSEECSQVERLTIFSLKGHRFHLQVGAHLFREEEPADDLYGVIEGVLRAERVSQAGLRQILGYYEQGNVIGCSLESLQRYSVVAVTASTLLRFSGQTIRQAAKANPLLTSHVAALTTRSICDIHDVLVLQATRPGSLRLSPYLLALFNRNPLRIKNREILELPTSRSNIAEMLGIDIDTVAYSMLQLQQRGIIRVHSARVLELLDRASLERLGLALRPVAMDQES